MAHIRLVYLSVSGLGLDFKWQTTINIHGFCTQWHRDCSDCSCLFISKLAHSTGQTRTLFKSMQCRAFGPEIRTLLHLRLAIYLNLTGNPKTYRPGVTATAQKS